MKCMIIEDELPAIKILQNHLANFPEIEIVQVHQNAVDALVELQRIKVDLIFLDIQLPRLTGLELLHSLKTKPAVILTTAFRDYAIQGYEMEITDYLLKPISFERFTKAVMKVYKMYEKPYSAPQASLEKTSSADSVDPFIYIKHEREFVKVLLNEIHYIESLKNHIKFHTVKGMLITHVGISEMEAKLPGNFIRIHRSFLVNCQHIDRFTANQVIIKGKSYPIGDLYKINFLKWVSKNMV